MCCLITLPFVLYALASLFVKLNLLFAAFQEMDETLDLVQADAVSKDKGSSTGETETCGRNRYRRLLFWMSNLTEDEALAYIDLLDVRLTLFTSQKVDAMLNCHVVSCAKIQRGCRIPSIVLPAPEKVLRTNRVLTYPS